MTMKKAIFASILFLLSSTSAFAEDVVLYSYAKTAQTPAEWAIMPIIADVQDKTPTTLFDVLKRKKLPTYGSTIFDAAKKSVQIDETKCAYGSIISAEIGQTFQAHGHAVPKFSCAGKTIAPAQNALPHFVAVIPLWQALTADRFDEPAVIQCGNTYLSVSEFKEHLKKQDKQLIKDIENDFNDPNLFVKSGAMKGYIARKFPSAEKRISKELASANSGNISAAMAALANTKDASIIAQMKTILQKKDAQQEAYALSMIDSTSQELRAESLIILLKSSNDANFNKAISSLEAQKQYTILKANADDILTNSTASHAEKVAELLISNKGESELQTWLSKTESSDSAQATAAKVLSLSNSPSLKRTAYSMQLTHTSPDVAFDALDILLADKQSNTDCWLRGLSSPHAGIHWASFEMLDNSDQIKAESTKGVQYIENAQNAPLDAIATLTSDAYNSDVKVRHDISYATKYFDTAGDSLRSILIKDSDETTASLVIVQTARRPVSDIQLSLIKEMMARSERSASVKIALLHAIPRMMNDKTIQTISTFASNEMFDGDISVKIAAIRALSEIAQRTEDPVIADNAITSLALTTQDKSKSIVHHTLQALKRTNLPAAREILDKF